MRKHFLPILLFSVLSPLILLCILFYYRADDTRSLVVKTVTHLETNEKVVALTFDDGPTQEKSTALLDLLKEKNVKATFFVVGKNIEKYPNIISRMNEEGHLIANHSYSHKRLIFRWPWTVDYEISKTETLLEELGVSPNSYFRPPYLDEMLILPIVLKQKDKLIVSYSIDPLAQYDKDYDPNAVSDFVIGKIKPGSIIILHDGQDANTSHFIVAVRSIIETLSQDGYRFVTIEYPPYN